MKITTLILAISAITLLSMGAAQANEVNNHSTHNQNFVSKRAYHEPVNNSVEKPAEEFEGATLELNDGDRAAIKNLHTLRLNQISKRSFY